MASNPNVSNRFDNVTMDPKWLLIVKPKLISNALEPSASIAWFKRYLLEC